MINVSSPTRFMHVITAHTCSWIFQFDPAMSILYLYAGTSTVAWEGNTKDFLWSPNILGSWCTAGSWFQKVQGRYRSIPASVLLLSFDMFLRFFLYGGIAGSLANIPWEHGYTIHTFLPFCTQKQILGHFFSSIHIMQLAY